MARTQAVFGVAAFPATVLDANGEATVTLADTPSAVKVLADNDSGAGYVHARLKTLAGADVTVAVQRIATAAPTVALGANPGAPVGVGHTGNNSALVNMAPAGGAITGLTGVAASAPVAANATVDLWVLYV